MPENEEAEHQRRMAEILAKARARPLVPMWENAVRRSDEISARYVRNSAEPFDLRSIVAKVLDESGDPDPVASVQRVLAAIPHQHRDTALRAALRVCCYVVADENAVGGSVIESLWQAPG